MHLKVFFKGTETRDNEHSSSLLNSPETNEKSRFFNSFFHEEGEQKGLLLDTCTTPSSEYGQ